MILRLIVEVPTSADANATFAELNHAAYHRHGITVTTARGYVVDVDLMRVHILDSKERGQT